jgi:hypothetical protein
VLIAGTVRRKRNKTEQNEGGEVTAERGNEIQLSYRVAGNLHRNVNLE